MINKNARIAPGVMVWFENLSNIGVCEVGTGSVLHSHIWIGDGVKIGKRVKVQAFVFIPTGVEIGDDVFIGPRVTFTNDRHPPSNHSGWEKTIVEDGVVIGAGAVILPGVVLGKGSIVGAGAVVTKSVSPGTIVVGNPARVIHKGEV